MTGEKLQSDREIFKQAVRMLPEERGRFLDQACAENDELRQEVESLLAAHDAASNFMAQPAIAGGSTALHQSPISERPGTIIGPYKLLEQIGEGGMGVVFMADQQAPVRRRVALKIIKPGMDTRQVIARFEAERQALAMMDHPNIAKVLDAGTTDTGRPYFVMELVKGVPITKYCDEKQLSLRQRLEIFKPVCEAVQHAHQKGVIHRDIKPNNVLVAEYDNRAVPKVIDFGVAKATAQKLTERTMFTEFGQVVGTFEYMSPEQAKLNQLDIDTRSDIYSLGVLLYELLTGSTPFEQERFREAAFDEVLRIIREEEPPKPSARLSTSETLSSIAAKRHIEPGRLAKEVHGELDWVVMKALEKDRTRRYESAAAMAEDIMHHLADEPVSAAAPSKIYRLRKFVERNKLSVFAACAVIAALVAGVIGTTIGLVGQSRQRAEAETSREQAEASREQLYAVNEFLTRDVLGGADPNRIPDKAVRDQIGKAMIDPAAATVAERFKDKPLLEAAVRHALAGAYLSIGRADLALPHARQALAIRRRELGDNHRDTLESVLALGSVLRLVGSFDEAAPLLREAVDGHRRELGDDDESTIDALTTTGLLRQDQGMFQEAEPLFREAVERSRRRYGDDYELTIVSINNLGWSLVMQGKLAEAEPLVTEAMQRARRVLDENHRVRIRATENMGVLLKAQGKFSEAEPFWRDGLALCRRVLGDDDPHTLDAINDLHGLLLEQGKFDEAEPLAREVLARRRRVLGENHQDTLSSMSNLGNFLRRAGKLDEAEPILQDVLNRARRVEGERNVLTMYAITNLGILHKAQHRLDLAEPLLMEAQTLCEKYLPTTHPLTSQTMYFLADLRREQGQLDEAKQLFEAALERRRTLLGDAHIDTMHVKSGLAMLLEMQGHAVEALPLFREVLGCYRSIYGDRHPQVGFVRMYVGRTLTDLSKYAEAEQELEAADQILPAGRGVQNERRQKLCENFVRLYEAWEKSEPGKGYSAKADQWRAKLNTVEPPEAQPGLNQGKK